MVNVVNSATSESRQYLYRGPDCVDSVCTDMSNRRKDAFEKMNTPKGLNHTLRISNARKHNKCFISGGDFVSTVKAKQKVKRLLSRHISSAT